MRSPLCLMMMLLAGCATAADDHMADGELFYAADRIEEAVVTNMAPDENGQLEAVSEPEEQDRVYTGPAYFPPSLGEPTVYCEWGGVRRTRPLPILSDFERNWYSGHLAAAGEPSLHLAAQAARPAGTASLRFTWLRSFHPPVTIRVETTGRSSRLVAKQLSGAGSYAPGEIARRIDRPLTGAEIHGLRRMLARHRVFELPPGPCQIGLDGASWIFEAVDESGYRFHNAWTPRNGPANALGRFLIGLTEWEVGDLY